MRSKVLGLVLPLLLCLSSYSKADVVTVPIGNGLSVTVTTGSATPSLYNINTNTNATNVTMGDDSNVNVPLGFDFPYYGKTFNNSWMYSNGAVSFQGGNVPGGFCCNGENLATLTNPAYNYSIMPLWTDLIAIQGGNHFVLKEPNAVTYGWYGVSEYYDASKRSSFELKIDSGGGIDVRFSGALVSYHPVTSGMVGDITKGEYYQYYHGYGLNSGPFGWNTTGSSVDICTTNPLSSQQCPGYEQAYLQQQCSANPLYSTQCSGYQQAFLEQQCSSNQLYSTQCPGYATAFAVEQQRLQSLQQVQQPVATQTTTQTQVAVESAEPAAQQTTTDVGGVAISTSGEIQTSPVQQTTTQPQQQSQQSAQQTQNAPAERRSVSLQTVLGILSRENELQQQALSVVQQSIATGNVDQQQAGVPDSILQLQSGIVSNTQTQTNNTQTQSVVQNTTLTTTNNQQQSQQDSFVSSQVEQTESKQENNLTNEAAAFSIRPQPPRVDMAPQPTLETVRRKGDENTMTQEVKIASIAQLPIGFDQYTRSTLQDSSFYKPVEIYKNQRVVDNRNAQRRLFGNSDQAFEKLKEQQYKD